MLKKFLKYKLVSALCSASFALAAGGMFWAYKALRGVSGPLILHFDNIHGITQIGGYDELLGIGATGIIIIMANFVIALELEARDHFLGKLLAAGTVVFSLLLFLGFASIISVN